MNRVLIASLALGICLPLLAAPAPKEAKNLLVNGSFEEGPETDVYKALDEGNKEIKGWIVTRGQIDYIGTHWKSAEGNRSLDLHGSPGIGGVKQSFKTTKGTKYKVTFSLAVNPNNTKNEKSVCVTAGDEKQTFKASSEGKTEKDMGWETKTWEFAAVGEETTLEIYSIETEDNFAGPALDNVSVVEKK